MRYECSVSHCDAASLNVWSPYQCKLSQQLHSVFITAGWHTEKTLQDKSIGEERERKRERDGAVGNPQCLIPTKRSKWKNTREELNCKLMISNRLLLINIHVQVKSETVPPGLTHTRTTYESLWQSPLFHSHTAPLVDSLSIWIWQEYVSTSKAKWQSRAITDSTCRQQ